MPVPLKDGDRLDSSVGKKTEAETKSPTTNEYHSEFEKTGMSVEAALEKSSIATIPKEHMKHIVTGSFDEDGQLKSGCHGQKGFKMLQSQGVLSNVQILSNGVRIANVRGHPDKSKSKHQGQVFFPENWSENKIAMSVKEIWRKNVNNIPKVGYHKLTDWCNGVKITIGFKDGKPENGYPEKYQR